jgi:hypothetical protein
MKTDAFHATLSVSADSSNHSSHQGHKTREKISRKRSIAERKSSSRANSLRRLRRTGVSARSDRSRKGLSRRPVGRSSKSERRSRAAKAGWAPERRARQAGLIRSWAPWRRSTGPKTDAGKARCAMNALKHGCRSQAKIREFQRIRHVLRLVAQNIERVRLFIRLRDARPRIKYKVPFRNTANGTTCRLERVSHQRAQSSFATVLQEGS